MITAISGNSILKKYVPKCIEQCIIDKSKKNSIAIKNTIKRSAIDQHLLKNPNCAKVYEKS